MAFITNPILISMVNDGGTIISAANALDCYGDICTRVECSRRIWRLFSRSVKIVRSKSTESLRPKSLNVEDRDE